MYGKCFRTLEWVRLFYTMASKGQENKENPDRWEHTSGKSAV